jgi:hypothetical protein
MEHTHEDSALAHPEAGGNKERILQLVLVVGDIVSFLAFAALGRSSHGEAAGLGAFLEVVKTAAPFLLGWFLAAPFLGAYRLAEKPGAPLLRVVPFARRTALAWLAAWPLGLALRALFLWRGIPVSFALVTFITNIIFLVGWRSLFAWLASRRLRH